MSENFDIHPAARDELKDIIRYYASVDDDGELAFDFEKTFYRCVDLIVGNSLLFNLRRPPTRRTNLTQKFGEYYIAYMIWREKVVILAIAHAKRRPYYWRNRITEAKKIF
ncbi:MAG: type II toxin-antitoxin system RelE/ParE family toxin [Verrucomicrobiota bacterium]